MNHQRDHYTILVVPHQHGRRWEWIVSRRVLLTGIVGAVLLTIGLVAFSAQRYIAVVRGLQAAQLKSQNEALHHQLSTVQERIGNLTLRMRDLSQTDRVMRVWTDIPEWSEDLLQLGVGGGTAEEPIWLGRVQDHTGSSLLEAYASLDAMSREARFLETSFGEILEEITKEKELRDYTPSILPIPLDTDHWISSLYGYRTDPISGRREFHNGIDIAGHTGTDIVATANGIVEKVEKDRRIGHYLAIDHGNGLRTVYGHLLKRPPVSPGQEIVRGDVIAQMGNTGRSTGPHVHYAISRNGRALNPLNYIFNSRNASYPF